MRHHDHGHAVLGKVSHDAQHISHELGVERRGCLVKEHDVRVHGERAGDGHALLLAAGELAGHVVDAVCQANLGELFDGDLLGLLGGALEDLLLGNHHVLLHAEVREEVELLKHHAQVRAHGVDVHALGRDLGAINRDGAARGGLQQVDAAQHGGLAGAGGPQHHDHLAAVDVEVDALEDDGLSVIGLVQVADLDDNLV